MKILAIETSCDETAAAVVENGVRVLGSAIASSTLMHAKYGGIVPEIAAREQVRCIIPTIQEALEQSHETTDSVDAVAVTVGPGLIGSLLVGVETAKTISFAEQKPVIPVNHVLAHMYANFIRPNSGGDEPSRIQPAEAIGFPAVSLVVSGGHTELFHLKSEKDIQWIGGTLDDAAGEAFDKTARLLGFENRGGPAIQEAALKSGGNPAIRLPRPMLDSDNVDNFSFSGLKTAILREVNALKQNNALTDAMIADLAFEVQETVTDVLVKKTLRAATRLQARSVLVSGGVSANLRLREKFQETIGRELSPLQLRIPPVSLCTDNAVYIAAYAYFRGSPADWHSVTAVPDLSVEEV